jgi:hypothetical protein
MDLSGLQLQHTQRRACFLRLTTISHRFHAGFALVHMLTASDRWHGKMYTDPDQVHCVVIGLVGTPIHR